jgi:hypothetical protein
MGYSVRLSLRYFDCPLYNYTLSDNYIGKCSVLYLGLALTPSPLPQSRERGEVVVKIRNINCIYGLLGQYNFLNDYKLI